MAKYKVITEKAQSRFLLIYTAIAILCFNIGVSSIPWLYIKPTNGLSQILCIFSGVAIFLILTMLISGILVIDAAKSIGDLTDEEGHF